MKKCENIFLIESEDNKYKIFARQEKKNKLVEQKTYLAGEGKSGADRKCCRGSRQRVHAGKDRILIA
jgi:hypothetical protein